ncbi:MAG TPA: TolC family protein [Cyclobacteriaceae bacterium]|nr:TolC family protein [Cyclobacteriaceae bacterium]
MNIHARLLLFTALLVTTVTQGRAQQVSVISLEESIEYALQNNVTVKNAQLDIVASKATVGETTAQGLPQITGNVDVNKNLIVPSQPFPAIFFDPEAQEGEFVPVQFSPEYSGNLGVTVNQMIFNGSYFVGLQAAKTYRQLAEFDKIKTENDVIENVKKAYYSVLVSQEREELVQANLSRMDTLLKETRVMFETGFSEKIDVSRIQVQYNNLKTELDRARSSTKISLDLLKLQMGMDVNQPLKLAESIADLEMVFDVEPLVDESGMRRVELDQLQTNLNLAKLDLKNNKAQYLPRIDANLNYTRMGFGGSLKEIFNSEWYPGSVLGVSLEIPIFDGLAKSYRIQQNRVQIKQFQNQLYDQEQRVITEEAEARANLQNGLRALEVQLENRELAMEVFRTTKIKYQEGVGSNFEVVEADAALKEAETNYYSALYDALIARVDLEKALGILAE